MADEISEIVVMFLQQRCHLTETGDLGAPQIVGDDAGRDIDAVEHIADVVQDRGGDLGHAGIARGRA